MRHLRPKSPVSELSRPYMLFVLAFFLIEIDHLRSGGLHAVSEFVGVDSGYQL